MPQSEIGKLNVRITASSAELDTALNKSETRVKGFAATTKNMLSGLATAGMAGFGFSQIIGFAKGIDESFREAARQADELQDQAAALGASASGLFAIRQGAFGATEAIDKGLEKLARDIGAAVNGSKEAEEQFQQLGLSSRQLAGMLTDDAFLLIADRINALPTASQKAAAAFDIFGKRGQALMETLGRGRKFFEELKLTAIDAGAVPSEQLGRMFDEWEQKSKKIGIEWQGIKNSVTEIMGLGAAQDIILAGIKQYRGFLQIGGGTEAEAVRLAEIKARDEAKAAAALAQQKKQREDLAKQREKELATAKELARVEQERAAQARDKLIGESLTPLEAANRQLLEMSKLLQNNRGDWIIAGRAAEKIADELIRAADIQQKAQLPAPDALLKGSQAARSFQLDLERRAPPEVGDKADQLRKAVEKLEKIEKEQKGTQDKILQVIREVFPLRIAKF